MSWSSQGYFPEYNYDTKRFDAPTWNVNCAGEEINEIENYDLRSVDLKDWEYKLKIFYGLQDGLFLKGYIESVKIEVIKELLDKFEGFLVYEDKYGGIKAFSVEGLIFYTVDNFTVFMEKFELSENEWSNFLNDLETYILPIDLNEKIRSKILHKIKTTANNTYKQ